MSANITGSSCFLLVNTAFLIISIANPASLLELVRWPKQIIAEIGPQEVSEVNSMYGSPPHK
jgi:hypothetical protein